MRLYRKIVASVTSFYDAKENAYHMLMLGMCAYLGSAYQITSNLETGLGRSDITLCARQTRWPHIIIEFKQGERIEQLAHEALEQFAAVELAKVDFAAFQQRYKGKLHNK